MKTRILGSLFFVFVAACGGGNPESSDTSESAVNGESSSARAYPFAARIDVDNGDGNVYACSGSIVAPRVILTAGHCVMPGASFAINAPFAGNSDATTTSAERLGNNYESGGPDIGLVYLAPTSAFGLSSYPARARTTPKGVFSTRLIGRRAHGPKAASNSLIISALLPTSIFDSRTDYLEASQSNGNVAAEHGDSGGPLLFADTNTIVGIVSGGPDYVAGRDKYTRLDRLQCWIASKIAAHGGEGISVETGKRPALSDFCPK